MGLARLEALLQGTVPIFGIDVSCTCPRTLARLGLGLGLGLGQLSPVDKFDKLKSGVIARGWIIIIFNNRLPVPESPKAFRYRGGLSPLLPLSLCGC